MRLSLLLLLCSCIAAPLRAQYFDTLHIRYDIGVAMPSAEGKAQLDSLADAAGDSKLLIYSYADYLGSEGPNQHLSDLRAAIVKDYLLTRGISPGQIMACTGLGQLPGQGGTTGDPESRRTDVFVRKKGPVKKIPPAAATPVVKDTFRITYINLDTLKENDAVPLNNINFEPGLSVIRPVSYGELENLYRVMRDNPRLRIRLEGHICCCVYPDGYLDNTPGWILSLDRARVVYRFLLQKGIAASRMQYKGLGHTRPIYNHEQSEIEAQANRRVEVRILAK